MPIDIWKCYVTLKFYTNGKKKVYIVSDVPAGKHKCLQLMESLLQTISKLAKIPIHMVKQKLL